MRCPHQLPHLREHPKNRAAWHIYAPTQRRHPLRRPVRPTPSHSGVANRLHPQRLLPCGWRGRIYCRCHRGVSYERYILIDTMQLLPWHRCRQAAKNLWYHLGAATRPHPQHPGETSTHRWRFPRHCDSARGQVRAMQRQALSTILFYSSLYSNTGPSAGLLYTLRHSSSSSRVHFSSASGGSSSIEK